MIKMIFSDMDGTLLDEAGNVPAGFGEVMAELKRRGVIFAPASGRQYYSLADTFSEYRDDFLFVAENGTLVMYKGEELLASPLRRSYALEVLQEGLRLPGIFSVFCGKRDAYILRGQDTPENAAELRKYYTHSSVVDDFREVEDEAIKVSFFDGAGRAGTSIYPYLKHFDGPMQVVRSSDQWIDVMRFGISKGIAIQQIQRKMRVTPMECAAFGDYMNDAEMMSSVYYSFAMGNAHRRIKELARFETATNAEGGVLAGIRRLMAEGLV